MGVNLALFAQSNATDTTRTVIGVVFLLISAGAVLIIVLGLLWAGIKPWLPKDTDNGN